MSFDRDVQSVIDRIEHSILVYEMIMGELRGLVAAEPIGSPEFDFCRPLLAQLGGRVAELEVDKQQWKRSLYPSAD